MSVARFTHSQHQRVDEAASVVWIMIVVLLGFASFAIFSLLEKVAR
jgi:hypothetical protein